jgi:hypothetical protein
MKKQYNRWISPLVMLWQTLTNKDESSRKMWLLCILISPYVLLRWYLYDMWQSNPYTLNNTNVLD